MEAAQESSPAVVAAPRLGFLGLSLVSMTALADFCLWRYDPRLSVGVFALGAAGIILANRPLFWKARGASWRAVCILGLICGAAAESAIDLCFSNVLVLLTLTLALAGETYYDSLPGGWSRWSEQLWTMIKTAGRWVWLLIELGKQSRRIEPMPPGTARKAVRILWIIIPGVVVTLLFAVILGNGNAMFAKFIDQWAAGLRDWIMSLHLSFWRCCFWAFTTWLALPLLRPSPAPKSARIWTKELPRLPELTSSNTARLQSVVTLALLNALFCCVNTIDAVYLWARQTLPADVNYSAFVHQGVSSLIIAVLFSAVLLAGMFQQSRGVTAWTPLRALGLVWIVQNLVLLAGVFLRVKLYVDAFELTVMRVNLVFFLGLVAIGFCLLAFHVWRQRSLGWLLHANMLAAFFLFYAVEFLDTEGYVARYNVRLWQAAGGARALDITYLESLGPPAFEAIEAVARSGKTENAVPAAKYLITARAEARHQLGGTPWPSWQLRAIHCQRKLLNTTVP